MKVRISKVVTLASSLLLFSFVAAAQQGTTPKAKASPAAKPPAKVAVAKTAETPDSSLPTNAVVDSFMRRMFGYNPAVTWKVVDISPSEIPGIARVLVTIGGQPQATQFYVVPGGQFAMVGEVIPFGADPFASARTKLDAEVGGPSRGAQNAPVTLVEFSDLQCPYCKTAQPIIDKLIAESANAKLIFQAFPLPMHPWAKKAAEYADCVAQQNQGAFWKFINSVYDAQSDITEATADEKFKSLATAAGVDAAKASACSTQPGTAARIEKSMDLGKEVGVSGTPTLFINGRKVQSIANTPIEQLKAMIDFEATQSAKKQSAKK
ncbi:MAG: oxidoreductase [Acidobacteriaceae bacterium]|nr:oxidoreductase [Acidobacteriaceae bacterium]